MSAVASYRLPGIFVDDHHSRDLPEQGHARVIREVGPSVIVEMDEDAVRDLYGDALHYTDPGIAEEMGLPQLYRSAKRVVAALRKQNPMLISRIDVERAEQARRWLR